MPARNQKQSDVFDLAASPLEAGVTLIEASAGTGKTYSLAGLILRLVTEELIPIKEILAVTFTIAATAELKERVRARLYDAFRQLKDEMPKDALTAQIAARTRLNESQRAIELALHSFDDAQVFTIHSFCQRVLQDYAFESGITFDGELVPDPSPLFREVAADFWRLKLSSVSNLVGAICISRNTSPSEWVQLLDRIRNHSDVAFIPPEHSKPLERLVSGLEDALGKVREEWQESGLEIERILRHDRALCRTRAAFHRDRVTELLRTIEQACGEVDCSEPAWLDATKELSTETIKARTRDNCAPPEHRFFQLCSKLQATVETVLLRLTYDFIEYQKREIPLRKTRTNTLSFDDLILKLREALQNGKQGKQLAKALRNSYRAVLVDEFQDTDPAQYAIFKHVFGAGAHHLYYIGDPKQAIYGFRGADVFTYLTATSDATRRLTLQTNWRAEDHLVRAVNTLFRQSEHPFILQKIAYHEITAAPEADFAHLAGLPKSARAPLSFRLVASTRPNASAMNKAEATAAVCEAVAADIHRLGSSRALLDHRTITFGDMAVLVRTHKEAEQVQDALRQQGIRSIVQSDVSVFASIEAAELHRFLHGVLEPARETLFKGALISSLVGLTGHDLVELDTDDTTRQAWLDKFFEWRNRWSTECFIAAFRQVVVDENVRARLVNLPAGERRLTNFLHLAELLHIAETTQRLRPDALLSWLGKQCQVDRVAQEQFQLRLESDTDAVQVITVHKAKGLEYPVVFFPFVWA
jgi:exodeoxyribonuclease V beta subunit